MKLDLEHHYAALPAHFFAGVAPTPVREPSLAWFNEALAAQLGLATLASVDPARLAALFSGNELPADARPIAMAYAGHQFAHFVPQLGDGRALLLGERRAVDGRLYDIQFKGSGRTPFSRGGDGRAALGPMLREALISEAMHALGIPTTRSLAVVATGERVVREEVLPGAILTRVASSHVRVGSFQYFAARADVDALRRLLDFSIARHYPHLATADRPALAFLEAVIDSQADLIAQWMAAGFIHGVMNTDNMAISGETIDYGPCAFMDHYDPNTVFSSIDHRGRYAYGNQPAIAQWNLARLAETLLPLIGPDPQAAVEPATSVLAGFMPRFDAQLSGRMRVKLGLVAARPDDDLLVSRLLDVMQQGRADFTLVFRYLSDAIEPGAEAAALRVQFREPAALDSWLADWRTRLALEPVDPAMRREAMQRANPLFIPRNHRVEAALAAASDRGDLAPFHRLLEAIRRPYEAQAGNEELSLPPRDDERVLATFCGT
jgi:serine/tyrosine/threonine adenylyltransferase